MIKKSIEAIRNEPLPCLIWVYRKLGFETFAERISRKNGAQCDISSHIFCTKYTYYALESMIKDSWCKYLFAKGNTDYTIVKKYKRPLPLKSCPVQSTTLQWEFLDYGPTIVPSKNEKIPDTACEWYRKAQNYDIPNGEIWFDDSELLTADSK